MCVLFWGVLKLGRDSPARLQSEKDVERADFTDEWWTLIIDRLGDTAVELGPTVVASPAIVPKAFPDEFYLQLVENGNRLERALRRTAVKPMPTVVVSLADLSQATRVMAIASIVSRSRISGFLLALVGNVEPRRELADPEELKGATRLIATLEAGGQSVTVAFSSSEMVLWKAAGATNCATWRYTERPCG